MTRLILIKGTVFVAQVTPGKDMAGFGLTAGDAVLAACLRAMGRRRFFARRPVAQTNLERSRS